MKHLMIVTCLIAMTFTTLNAQETKLISETDEAPKLNLLKVSTTAILLGNFKMTYERVLTNKFTTGGMYNMHSGSQFGAVKLEPCGRFYLAGKAPSGLYVMPKIHVGYAHVKGTSFNLFEYGASSNAGWQFITGRSKNFVIDLFAGVRISSFDGVANDNLLTDAIDQHKRNFRNQFSNSFDFGASIGYRF